MGPVYNFVGNHKFAKEQTALAEELHVPESSFIKSIHFKVKPPGELDEEQKKKFSSFVDKQRSFGVMMLVRYTVNFIASVLLVSLLSKVALQPNKKTVIKASVIAQGFVGFTYYCSYTIYRRIRLHDAP